MQPSWLCSSSASA